MVPVMNCSSSRVGVIMQYLISGIAPVEQPGSLLASGAFGKFSKSSVCILADTRYLIGASHRTNTMHRKGVGRGFRTRTSNRPSETPRQVHALNISIRLNGAQKATYLPKDRRYPSNTKMPGCPVSH